MVVLRVDVALADQTATRVVATAVIDAGLELEGSQVGAPTAISVAGSFQPGPFAGVEVQRLLHRDPMASLMGESHARPGIAIAHLSSNTRMHQSF